MSKILWKDLKKLLIFEGNSSKKSFIKKKKLTKNILERLNRFKTAFYCIEKN